MTQFTSKEAFENWLFKNGHKEKVKLAEEAWESGFNYALELLKEPNPNTLNAMTFKECLDVLNEALKSDIFTPSLSQELVLHAFNAGKRFVQK